MSKGRGHGLCYLAAMQSKEVILRYWRSRQKLDYGGADTGTGRMIRVGELTTVERGKIKTSVALFGGPSPE